MATLNRLSAIPFTAIAISFVFLAAKFLAIPGPRFLESCDSRFAILVELWTPFVGGSVVGVWILYYGMNKSDPETWWAEMAFSPAPELHGFCCKFRPLKNI